MNAAPQAASAQAPGKLFLFGEYAVLEGHGAMIAAVDRHVTARCAPTSESAFIVTSSLWPTGVRLDASTRGLRAAIGGELGRVAAGILAARELGARAPAQALSVDSSPLFDGARKLGFGSSAAVVVAVAAALAKSEGHRLDRTSFKALKHWHSEAQGVSGSGGDIAASLMGGLAWLEHEQVDSVRWVPPLAYVTHPSSASTPKLVSNVKRLKANDLALYQQHLQQLGALARAALDAARQHDAALFVRLVAQANTALGAFGRDAETAIITPFHERLLALLEPLDGVAVKTTGAGGGDLSLIAAANDERLTSALEACAREGIRAERLTIAEFGAAGA